MKDPTDDRFRRQYGVISRGDAVADGLSRPQIRRRVQSGLWLEPMPVSSATPPIP